MGKRRLTGRYYLNKRVLGGWHIYVEEEYEVVDGYGVDVDIYMTTRFRKAKEKDITELGLGKM